MVLDLTSDYWLHNAAAAPSAECRLSADVDDRQTHGQRHQVSVPLLGAGVIKKLSLAGSRRNQFTPGPTQTGAPVSSARDVTADYRRGGRRPSYVEHHEGTE